MTLIALEKKLYLESEDKQSYEHVMTARAGEMIKRYILPARELQNHMDSDAVRQAQLQEDLPANVLPEVPIPQPAMPILNQGSGHFVSPDPAAKPLAPVPSPPPPIPPNPGVPSPQRDLDNPPSYATPGHSDWVVDALERALLGLDGATDSTFEPAWPGPSSSPRVPSSYWSVEESEAFPGLLRTFGSDWARIAASMQTKTPTMVEDFFVRHIADGGRPKWVLYVMEADARLQRGIIARAPPSS
ncbi:hypothetical protein F5144DRAFT_584376 [Chaetomium tenue]|uniref:Uncharacterized protein n=1 Tax=Chaetomium tenue TaxID=1854479 RepID=A0ACB7P590_9PEZI|nr:hypothetical protein F5144DRAFT_584376 [Chaetomium globosum]